MAGCERDLPAQQVGSDALEFRERPRLRRGQQSQRRFERAGPGHCLRRGQRALRPPLRVGCQRGRAVQEGSRRREPAARLRAAGRALELCGDVLVGPGCGLGPVPGTAVGIDLRIGRPRQRAMRLPPVVRRGRPVDRRADQRVAEGYPGAYGEQPVRLSPGRCFDPDPEPGGRPPQQRRVAGRLGRGQQEQEPGRRWERGDPPPEDVLNATSERPRVRQPEPAGQVRRGYPAGQFEQGQRVAAGFGDDPVPDPLIWPPRDDRGKQRPGIRVRESRQRQPGQPSQAAAPGRIPGAEQQGDRFGVQPPGREPQRLRRGLVQPLRVIDQAQQRLVRGPGRELLRRDGYTPHEPSAPTGCSSTTNGTCGRS
jgi:hypothetical protein